MRFLLNAGVALAAGAVLVAGFSRIDASTGPIPLNCNRACLENLIDQYLTAVVAHDPKKLPLSADVRYTENYQVLQIGDGFWKTAQARGKYTHIFADPEAGQVASMGTMIEADQPLLMSLRLRIELGRITEDAFAMDCMTQFKLGYYFVVQSIHGRRYPVVDQERGVVWAHGVIDQGTVNSGVLSNGKPYTFAGFNRPSSILFTEAFLIEDGKIRRVEMVGPSVPFHMNSPWPGGLSGQ